MTQKGSRRVFIQAQMQDSHPRRILRGVGRFAHQLPHPWRLEWGVYFDTGHYTRVEQVDGVMYFNLPEDTLQRLDAAKIPSVRISGAEPSKNHPQVVTDSIEIGRMAARHFLKRLHTHFAFVGFREHQHNQERLQGFQAEIGDREVQVFWYETGSRVTRWGQELGDFLQQLPPGCAVFAANDNFALRVVEAAEDRELSLPGDLTLVGADNDLLLVMASPVPFSSVDPGSEELGYRAAQRLHALMEGAPHAEERVEFVPPVGVVLRKSSDHLATDDVQVAKAVRLIRSDAVSGLTVEALCRQLGMSRRTLERRFHAVLGTTPKEELLSEKIRHAGNLLATTPLSVQQVAFQSGFTDPLYFSTAFKRSTGKSPRAWRAFPQDRRKML